MGMAVLCTHVLVQRWRRRTNDDWGTSESARANVVGSTSKMEAISFEWGTGTKWYTGPPLQSEPIENDTARQSRTRIHLDQCILMVLIN